ncbi:MAG: hypothetical protein HN348_16760 [Proteobacteria bacterium]|nr:hypothetical protein [Pseudomonadota bacterium]
MSELKVDPSLVADPPRLVRILEEELESCPTPRGLLDALFHANDLLNSAKRLPPVIGGVRRSEMVRWDSWTATWDGTNMSTGSSMQIRVLREGANRDPVLRRALVREARVLRNLVPGVTVLGGEWPSLIAPHPGPALTLHQQALSFTTVARMFGSALGDLQKWEDAGLGIEGLSPLELRETPQGLRFVCLTPGRPEGMKLALEQLAGILLDQAILAETSIVELLQSIAALPPETAGEAGEMWCRALAADLTAQRHALQSQWHGLIHSTRAARLMSSVQRLLKALPPPPGRGAVGVGLEGETLAVECADGVIRWGSSPAQLVYDGESGFEARESRRMLRSRASALPNARLSKEIGGELSFTENICRWVSAGLKLRTIGLLLNRSAGEGEWQ